MARPWVRMYWIETDEMIPGREDALSAPTVAALAYLHRDKDYRIAWDASADKWCVYYRLMGDRQ